MTLIFVRRFVWQCLHGYGPGRDHSPLVQWLMLHVSLHLSSRIIYAAFSAYKGHNVTKFSGFEQGGLICEWTYSNTCIIIISKLSDAKCNLIYMSLGVRELVQTYSDRCESTALKCKGRLGTEDLDRDLWLAWLKLHNRV